MEKLPLFYFKINPRFSPFLLYVRCKSGVTFVRSCFRDDCSRSRGYKTDRSNAVDLLWFYAACFQSSLVSVMSAPNVFADYAGFSYGS